MGDVMYQVLTKTLCDGFINCWTIDGEPWTFETREEAQAEIDDLLQDLSDYSADDYKIEKVQS